MRSGCAARRQINFGIDPHVSEGRAGGAEADEVVDVSEVVEAFVGVFDCEFGHGWIDGCAGEHRCVEIGAMGGALEWRQDNELRYALAGW